MNTQPPATLVKPYMGKHACVKPLDYTDQRKYGYRTQVDWDIQAHVTTRKSSPDWLAWASLELQDREA